MAIVCAADTVCALRQAGAVVADGEDELICDQSFIHKIKGQKVGHLPDNKAGLTDCIRPGENLAGAKRTAGGPVGFNVSDGAWFPAPGVVNEKFCVDPEKTVQKILIIVI